jgi:Asp-tRNA(Asn)/Glu-tRNA(Gln) amidotransferase A subunit family amidase
VATLRRQFGVVMGKTHMVEFAFGGTGQNSHWGAPHNPWDAAAHRSPGGSSSGAGISLLESSALLAFGSDTAGSVRIPACMTGNVGLKVTLGRWSTEGVVPLSTTFDTPGLLARSVSDVAYGFMALDPAGRDPVGFMARSAAPRLDAVDVIASPTLCLTPPLMSEVADADSHLRINRRIVRNTVAVNYLGLCAITIPVGFDRAGMPIGLQLTAPAGAEERLLAIALAAERVLGTAADRLGTPPLLAS